jgi:hypothetical protein
MEMALLVLLTRILVSCFVSCVCQTQALAMLSLFSARCLVSCARSASTDASAAAAASPSSLRGTVPAASAWLVRAMNPGAPVGASLLAASSKKATRHIDPRRIPNHTLPRAKSKRAKGIANFDRFNLKPEFVPRWYLAAKQKMAEAAAAKAAAAPKAKVVPAHQTASPTRLTLRAMLADGNSTRAKTGAQLFAEVGANFASRAAFGLAMRSLVRQRLVRVDPVFPAAAAASAAAPATSAAVGAPTAPKASKRRAEFMFAVRDVRFAMDFLGQPRPEKKQKQKKAKKANAGAATL